MDKIDLTQLGTVKTGTTKNSDKFDNFRITQKTESDSEVTVAYVNVLKTSSEDFKGIMDKLVEVGVFAGFYNTDERTESPVKSGLSVLNQFLGSK